MTPLTRLAWVLFLASLAGCAPAHHRGTLAAHAPLAVRTDPQLIEMNAEATASLVLASTVDDLGVRVRIAAHALPAAQRPPLDLALVLDTSGSMEGEAIAAVRASAKAVLDKMRDGDRISVVVFHSHADVLVPNVIVGAKSRTAIARAIDDIKARGTTDLAGGLSLGLSQLSQSRFPEGINRVVLLSDGVPNSSAALPNMIAALHDQGISVTSLGVGPDYDTKLMTQIARDTGGNFHYIEKPEELAAVFDDELTRMTTVVGRNLQLQLQPGPGVTIEAMPGLQALGDGRFLAMIGDLPAGEVRDLMIPIKVAARAPGSTAELIEATLSYDDVIGNSGRHDRDAYVGVKASEDAAAVKAAVKVGLEVQRIRASAAASILYAMQLARAGQVAPGQQQIASALAAVRTAQTKLKDPQLAPLADELDQVSRDLAQIRPPRDDEPMKKQKMDKPPATAPEPGVEPRLRRSEERAESTMMGH